MKIYNKNNHRCFIKKSLKILMYSVVFLLIILLLFEKNIPFFINLSKSMPIGIYQSIHKNKLQRGDLVVACLPQNLAEKSLLNGYLLPGKCKTRVMPLLKQIVGLDGDVIQLTSNGVMINKQLLSHSKLRLKDKNKKNLNAFKLNKIILRNHQVWLYGISSERSWDSRYYGPIDISCIKNVVRPWLILNYRR